MLKYKKKALFTAGTILLIAGGIYLVGTAMYNSQHDPDSPLPYTIPDALIVSGLGCLLWGTITK